MYAVSAHAREGEPGSHYWEKGREQVMWELAGVFAGDTACGPEVEESRETPQDLRVRLWQPRRPLGWRTMRSDESGKAGRCCAAPGCVFTADCAPCELV